MANKIFFTSDLHFNHNREFIFNERGFSSINEMNEAIVNNWNNVVEDNDDVYVLGDLMLGGSEGSETGVNLIKRLNGRIHIVIGNHDTDRRIELYKTIPSVVSVSHAERLKWNGYHFWLSHFPANTSNLEKETLKQVTINISGHTHSKSKFYKDIPYIYNCAVDAHDCTPVSVEEVIKDIKEKIEECKSYL